MWQQCRRCDLTIEKQAVSSSDGQLKGKYHRECFNCHVCHVSALDLLSSCILNNARCRNPFLTGRSTSLMANRSVHIIIMSRITPCALPRYADNRLKVHAPCRMLVTAITPSTSHANIPDARRDWSSTGKSTDGCYASRMPLRITEVRTNGMTITEGARRKTRKPRRELRSSLTLLTVRREVT